MSSAPPQPLVTIVTLTAEVALTASRIVVVLMGFIAQISVVTVVPVIAVEVLGVAPSVPYCRFVMTAISGGIAHGAANYSNGKVT
jgi:hypothetical protein